MIDKHEVVVAYANMKGAALYFPYVIPVVSCHVGRAIDTIIDLWMKGADWKGVVQADLEHELPMIEGKLSRLLPPHLKSDNTFMRLLKTVPIWEVLNELLTRIQEIAPPSNSVNEGMAKIVEMGKERLGVDFLHDESLDASYDTLMEGYDLDSFQALVPDEWVKLEAKVKAKLGLKSESPELRVSLVNANLIDTSSVSWDQIIAFKEDVDSQKKLQGLRRFLSTNYEGKSQSYIEDDLHLRLEDHDATVRKFGFETKAMVLEAFFTSNWLRASAAGAGIAALCGQPLAALASGFTGVLFEVGNTAVKVVKHNFELNQIAEHHPLGYIIDAKEKLEAR